MLQEYLQTGPADTSRGQPSLHHAALTHSFAELCVHHEVVDMFLSLGQLQLSGHHCNHQRSATSSLSHKDAFKVSTTTLF